MNIVVFIKQVPDTDDVKWTSNNNIDRANTDSILNPLDKEALEAAIRLKNVYGAKVSAVSMGPSKAVEILKEAIAMGVDEAVLLCDSKFAGSDTCATSKILTAAIKEKLKDTDLIIFGQSASDGETAQTGPAVAVRLNLPFITYVSEIVEVLDKSIIVNSQTEFEYITYKVSMPAVLCVQNYVYKPHLPRIEGYIRSADYNYIVYNMFELKINENETGIKGSPTYVSKAYRIKEGRNCRFIDTAEIIQQIKEVV